MAFFFWETGNLYTPRYTNNTAATAAAEDTTPPAPAEPIDLGAITGTPLRKKRVSVLYRKGDQPACGTTICLVESFPNSFV